MILRLLNPQGIAGIAASICLAMLLLVQKGETRRWHKQSDQYQSLYAAEQARLGATVADYRAAADRARAGDLANLERVRAAQSRINERTSNDYESRLAAARARAAELRKHAPSAPADSGRRGAAPVPSLSAPAGTAAQAPGQDRLSRSDRLTATEQAIQLDELIEWVRAQAEVDPNLPR